VKSSEPRICEHEYTLSDMYEPSNQDKAGISQSYQVKECGLGLLLQSQESEGDNVEFRSPRPLPATMADSPAEARGTTDGSKCSVSKFCSWAC
jgi:hypothetical protein